MITFSNPGEIDIRGATVAGLSAKTSDSPIGFFGTGLKYALACILRWRGEIEIWSGETCYQFQSKPVEFRGQSFEQITMNGQELGFTIEYGKNWEPWQVFRELYANARDEGGEVVRGQVQPSPGQTTIQITCREVEACFAPKDEIILPDDANWLVETPKAKVANKVSKFVYYRGVKVWEKPSLLQWNLLEGVDLTEDRTIKYAWQVENRISVFVRQMQNEDLITRILTAPGSFLEASLEWEPYSCSDAFVNVAKRLYKQSPIKWQKLRKVIEEYAGELLEPAAIDLSPMRAEMLEKSIQICAKMGLEAEWPIIVAELGKERLGLWDGRRAKIYLSPEVFNQGTKQVVSTLYEELLHAHTGYEDCSYPMQTHLFNTIVSLFEEHVLQEPI